MLREPGVVRVSVAAFLLAFMQSISGAFMPLFGLYVGLTLAEVGVIGAGERVVVAVEDRRHGAQRTVTSGSSTAGSPSMLCEFSSRW